MPKKKKATSSSPKTEGDPTPTLFAYESDGVVTSNALGGWDYSLREAALRQLELQPQYRSLLGSGWIGNPSVSLCAYHMTNMAIGLADGSYREAYNTPDTETPDGRVLPSMSEFAKWVEDYKPMIYVDIEKWIRELPTPSE